MARPSHELPGSGLAWVVLISLAFVGRAEASDLAYEQESRFEIKSAGAHRWQLRSWMKVSNTYLTESVLGENTFVVHEPWYAKLKSIKARRGTDRIPGDRISELPTRYEDVFMGSSRAHLIMFPDNLIVGEQVSYEYELDYDDLAYMPMLWVPAFDRVTRFDIDVEHPPDLRIEFEVLALRDSVNTQVDRSDEKRTRFKFQGNEIPPDLPYYPFNHAQAVILISVFSGDSLLTPTRPAELVSWYAAQTPLEPTLDPSTGQDSTGDSALWIRSADVAELHRFVRDAFRYVGDSRSGHAIIPYAPETVLKRRYGDCKDRSTLLCALGRSRGRDLLCGLVSTDPEPVFAGVHINTFNHMVCIDVGGPDTVYYDPTARYFVPGDVPGPLHGQRVLILDPSEPRFAHLPAALVEPEFELLVEVSDRPDGKAPAELVLRGDLRAELLPIVESGHQVAVRRAVTEILHERVKNLAFLDPTLDRNDSTSLHLRGTADLTRFVVVSDSLSYLPTTPFWAVRSDILERKRDELPLWFDAPADWVLQLRLKGWHPTASDTTWTLGDVRTALHTASLGRADLATALVSYRFVRPGRVVESAARQEFMSFAERYLEANNKLLVLGAIQP